MSCCRSRLTGVLPVAEPGSCFIKHNMLRFDEAKNRWSLEFATHGKAKDSLCRVKFCRRPRAIHSTVRRNGRTITLLRSICNTCHSVIWRANHPVQYRYKELRHSAARRGIKFTLTLEQFWHIIKDTPYLYCAGISPGDYHFDRINPAAGYEYGNCQVITCSENCRKDNNPNHLRDRFIEEPF